MTTGKTIALIRQTFISKVKSLLFNMLSRLIIVFLPRSSVQSLSSVRLYFGGSEITADVDCRHAIKRWLLLGRKL